MADYNITAIKGDEATLDQLKQFTAVPFFIPWYRSAESHKVFPLFINDISDLNPSRNFAMGLVSRNPYFDNTDITYFIADDGTKPVGRIAAFVDRRYNEENRKNAGGIGLFECIEDPLLAEKLLAEAIDDIVLKGCDEIDRTSDFDTNRMNGVLVDGFQYEPYFMEPYTAPYYPGFFEHQGFTKRNDWYSIQVDDTSGEQFAKYMDKVRRTISHLEASPERGKLLRECTIRNADFSKSKFEGEVGILEELYNLIWAELNHALEEGKHHPQQVTFTHPQMNKLATDIKLIDREEYVQIVEHFGKNVGISASVPNINEKISAWDRRHPNYEPSLRFYQMKDLARDVSIFQDIMKNSKRDFESMRVLILGVKEEYRKAGLDGALYLSAFDAAMNNGIRRASLSQLADINKDIVNPLTKMGPIAMTWRVYGLEL